MLSPNLNSKLLKLRKRVLDTMHPLRIEIQSAPKKRLRMINPHLATGHQFRHQIP